MICEGEGERRTGARSPTRKQKEFRLQEIWVTYIECKAADSRPFDSDARIWPISALNLIPVGFAPARKVHFLERICKPGFFCMLTLVQRDLKRDP